MTTLATLNAKASPEVQMNENFEAVSAAGLFGLRRPALSGLTWAYYGGSIANGSGYTDVANGTVALTNNATNYIEATTAGVVSANTTGFTAGRVPLYTVVTASGAVTTITDRRSTFGSFYNGPMSATTLTIATGTITTSNPALTRTQTWNAGGVTFVGSTTDITDTASASGSVVERWRVGGADKMSLSKAGALTLASSLTATGVTVTSGTITSSAPAVDGTQTWNSGGTTFTGRKLNITDTASASASLLDDLQVGGSSKFSVRKDGLITGAAGLTIAGALAGATTIAASGQITSTVSTGTAPLVIASTTQVSNLNSQYLGGKTWAAPDPIGSGTPAAVTATALTASGTVTLSGLTASRVPYLDGSKVLTTGSVMQTDGTNVGIGVSPVVKLQVDGILGISTSGTYMGSLFDNSGAVDFQAGSNATGGFRVGTSAAYPVRIYTNGTDYMTVSSVGALRAHAYGAGTLTTDGSGNITAVSDPALKRRIRPYTRGLADIVALVDAGGVIRHGWSIGSGLDLSKIDYAGFDAAIVERWLPEAVGRDKLGLRTLDVRPLIGAHSNALAEVARRLDVIENRLTD